MVIPARSVKAIAYSYLRFSSKEQAKGDSLRRQIECRDAFVQRHGLTLDNKLRLTDAGVSSFKSKNRSDKHALGRFLSLVDAGLIAPGSYLLVESLDRLSRDEVDEALEMLLGLTRKGIIVVQLQPVEVVYQKPVDSMKLMMGIMELSRGHSESKMKSERCGAAWENKRQKARTELKAISKKCPLWLRRVGDKYEPIPERAAAVKRIFELAASGYGIVTLIRKLLEEGHTPFRAARWSPSYVGRILDGRAALGEYQPCKAAKPYGDPIEGFYPAVITPALYGKARQGIEQRFSHIPEKIKPHKRKPRRVVGPDERKPVGLADPVPRTKHDTNLFKAIMWSALDGGKIEQRTVVHTKEDGRKYTSARYINSIGLVGQGPTMQFPVQPFVAGVMACLSEVDPNDVVPQHGRPDDELMTLSGEVDRVNRSLREIEEQILAGESLGVLVTAGKKFEAKKAELSKRMEEVRRKACNPLSEAWSSFRGLCKTMGMASDQEAVRLQFRQVFRRLVKRMDCIFCNDGFRQAAFVQIKFADSEHRRSIVMLYRRELVNRRERKRPRLQAWTTAGTEEGDIREPEGKDFVLSWLKAMCADNKEFERRTALEDEAVTTQ